MAGGKKNKALQSQVESLEESNTEKDYTIWKLEKLNEDNQRRTIVLEDSIVEMKENETKSKECLKDITNHVSALEDSLKRKSDESNLFEEKYKKMQKLIQVTVVDKRQLLAQVTESKIQVVKGLRVKVSSLEQQLADSDQENLRLQGLLENMTTENQRMLESSAERNMSLESTLVKENNSLKKYLALAQTERHVDHDVNEKISKVTAEKDLVIEVLEGKNLKLKVLLTQEKADLEEKKKIISERDETIQDLNIKIECDSDHLSAKIFSLQQEVRTCMKEKEREIVELKIQNKNFKVLLHKAKKNSKEKDEKLAEAAATDTNTGLHKPATEQLNAMKLELKAKDEGILTLRALNEQLKVQAQNDREASEAKDERLMEAAKSILELQKSAKEQETRIKTELKTKDGEILHLRALNEQFKVLAKNEREASEAKDKEVCGVQALLKAEVAKLEMLTESQQRYSTEKDLKFATEVQKTEELKLMADSLTEKMETIKFENSSLLLQLSLLKSSHALEDGVVEKLRFEYDQVEQVNSNLLEKAQEQDILLQSFNQCQETKEQLLQEVAAVKRDQGAKEEIISSLKTENSKIKMKLLILKKFSRSERKMTEEALVGLQAQIMEAQVVVACLRGRQLPFELEREIKMESACASWDDRSKRPRLNRDDELPVKQEADTTDQHPMETDPDSNERSPRIPKLRLVKQSNSWVVLGRATETQGQ